MNNEKVKSRLMVAYDSVLEELKVNELIAELDKIKAQFSEMPCNSSQVF